MSKSNNIRGFDGLRALVTRESWLRIAAIIVGAEFVLASAAALAVGYRVPPPVIGYVPLFFGTLILPVLLLLFIRAAALYRQPSPVRALCAGFYEDRDRLAVVAIGIALALLQKAALTWLKPTLPMFGGFWADPLLADIEKWLLGDDAWRWSYAIFGSWKFWIDIIYHLWFPVIVLAFFAVLLSRSAAKPQVAVAYFLTVALAMFAQFLMPSAGPIFWGRLGLGDRFAELVVQMPPMSRLGADFLWKLQGFDKSAAAIGISAWPSVHVALASWAIVAAARLCRPAVPAAILWWAAILVGSVHLGWHYLLDGIAGVIIAALAYYAAGRILGTPPQTPCSEHRQNLAANSVRKMVTRPVAANRHSLRD